MKFRVDACRSQVSGEIRSCLMSSSTLTGSICSTAASNEPLQMARPRGVCTSHAAERPGDRDQLLHGSNQCAPRQPERPNDQQIYLRALRTIPNLSITYGHFLTHSVSMALTGVTPTKRVWVDKTEEKGSDVNLASHLLRDACSSLPGGGADHERFGPRRAGEVVRQELNLPIGILNPHQQHSAELKRVATFVKRIRQSDLIASQFPAVLTDAKGTIQKPPSW